MREETKTKFALLLSLPVVILIFVVFNVVYIRSEVHLLNMLKIVAIALAFVAHTYILRKWIINTGLAVTAALVYLMLAGFLPLPFHHIFWATGLVSSIYLVMNLIKMRERNFWFKMILASGVVTLLLIPYFNLTYSEPFNDMLISRDGIHIDNYYHVAIASMIKNYHQVSHGLHGLGQLEYHFGSHLFMASASNLLNMSTFASYSYFFSFFFIPLFCIVILLVAEDFYPSENIRDVVKKCVLLIFVFVGSGIFQPGSLLYKFALWPSFFESESYTVSLVFFLILMSLLKKVDKLDWFTAIAVIMVIFFTSLSKVSTGFCGLIFVGSWALLTKDRWFSRQWYHRWTLFFTCALIFLLTFKMINSGKGDGGFSPLHFVKNYISFDAPISVKILLMILLHFIFPVTILALSVKEHRTFRIFIKDWWSLGTLLITLVGIGVLLCLSIMGGSAYYFSNVSMFAALPLVINIGSFSLFKHSLFAKIVLSIVLITGLVLYVSRIEWYSINVYVHQMRQVPTDSVLQNYFISLQQIRDDKGSLDGVVHIPRTETKFYESMFCRKTGYFISALSERAALYAWPSFQCYDFLCGDRFHSNGLCDLSQQNYNDDQLLTEARRIGFKKVYVVTLEGVRILQ